VRDAAWEENQKRLRALAEGERERQENVAGGPRLAAQRPDFMVGGVGRDERGGRLRPIFTPEAEEAIRKGDLTQREKDIVRARMGGWNPGGLKPNQPFVAPLTEQQQHGLSARQRRERGMPEAGQQAAPAAARGLAEIPSAEDLHRNADLWNAAADSGIEIRDKQGRPYSRLQMLQRAAHFRDMAAEQQAADEKAGRSKRLPRVGAAGAAVPGAVAPLTPDEIARARELLGGGAAGAPPKPGADTPVAPAHGAPAAAYEDAEGRQALKHIALAEAAKQRAPRRGYTI
jgi:hypothetical protein